MEDLIIGSHVHFEKKQQLLGSVLETIDYGANAFMFYTGAPQNTSRCDIDLSKKEEAFKLMEQNNIDRKNIIVHAPYIINLASDGEKHEFAVNFLKQEIKRVELLGFDKIVLHPGSSVKLTTEEGIKNIISGLNEVLSIDTNVKILLETMAGKGSECGRNFDEIKQIIDGVLKKENIGVCMDTCHIHDGGYDLTNFDEVLEQFDKKIGLNKLYCIHINDSKNIMNSHKDRHENIGYGKIGFDTLIYIIYHEKLRNIPKILETPYVTQADDKKDKIYPPYKFEIEMIKNRKFNSNLIEEIRKYY